MQSEASYHQDHNATHSYMMQRGGVENTQHIIKA